MASGFNVKLESKFELQDILGEGGFGIVIKATEYETKKKFAIKILLKNKYSNNEQEFNIHSKIEHKNIVQLYYVRENNKLYFLFMELMEGGSLKDLIIKRFYLDEGKEEKLKKKNAEVIDDDDADLVLNSKKLKRKYLFTKEEVRLIISSILEAVNYLHNRNIIHRDIKPGNQFLLLFFIQKTYS